MEDIRFRSVGPVQAGAVSGQEHRVHCVLMVSDARSVHTQRWVTALRDSGLRVVLFSLHPPGEGGMRLDACDTVYDLFGYKSLHGWRRLAGALSAHWGALRTLRRCLRRECPDLLHAHYATSYGLVAALAGFRPFLLSVWGSDIYEFPRLSRGNRLAVSYMLRKADRVLSTGLRMAAETRRYADVPVGITPFGVDLKLFRPAERRREPGAPFVFGVVKSLSPKYGIDVAIRALRLCRERRPDLPVRLEIYGRGPEGPALEALAAACGVGELVRFGGFVEHGKLPEVFARFDAGLYLSRAESFGVAAVEAMACGVPVVVSDADGFREVTGEGECALLVPRDSAEDAASAMMRLMEDSDLCRRLAAAGRERVKRLYDWRENVDRMRNEYETVYARCRGKVSNNRNGGRQ